MIKEIYSDVSVGIVFAPLSLTHGLTVENGVGEMQQYDISAGTWLPDWTLAPLVLRPWLSVTDPDGVIEDGEQQYTNTRWFLTEDCVEKELTTDSEFVVPVTGEDVGILVVKRNASPGHPLSLRFEGDYADTRTGEVHHVVETKVLMCESVATPPVLTVDQAEMTYYNPVRATSHSLLVHASLKVGADEVDAANREFVWEMLRDDGTWSAVGEETTDYCVEVSDDGTEATVYMSHMGKSLDLRVRARYDAYGNPGGVTLDAGCPEAVMHFRRKLTKLHPIPMVFRRLSHGQTSIPVQGLVEDCIGVIDNAEEFFKLNWYTAIGQANGSLVFSSTPVAEGANTTLPTTAVHKSYGGHVRLGITDRGWLRSLTINGSSLTVGGKILLVKA